LLATSILGALSTRIKFIYTRMIPNGKKPLELAVSGEGEGFGKEMKERPHPKRMA